MSDPIRDTGQKGPKRPPDNSDHQSSSTSSPTKKQLKERVTFFEKVWTGGASSSGGESDEGGGGAVVDVNEIERRIAEERARNLIEHQSHLEQINLRHTPTATGSPSRQHVVQRFEEIQPDGSVQAWIYFMIK